MPLCGFTFEYFMRTASGYAANKKWLREVARVQDGNAFDDSTQQHFWDTEKSMFMGWLLFHVNSIGSNGCRQLFYITFVSSYYGLSRNGVHTLSEYGYGISTDLFDKYRKQHTEMSANTIEYEFL